MKTIERGRNFARGLKHELKDIFTTTPPATMQEHEARQNTRMVTGISSAVVFTTEAAPILGFSLANSTSVPIQVIAGIWTVLSAAGAASTPFIYHRAEKKWRAQGSIPGQQA